MEEAKGRVRKSGGEINKSRNGKGGNKEEVEKTKEAREEGRTAEGNSNKGKTVKTGTTVEAGTEKEKELSGLAVLDKPDEIVVEVEEKKKKKTKKTTKKDRIKDEIRLALVAVYGVAGALIDECFFLKPSESELFAEAIYRYLEEHNLLDTLREKSAMINLIVVVLSVNIPKIYTYYEKIRKERSTEIGRQDKSKKIDESYRQDIGGSRGGRRDIANNDTDVKVYLNELHGGIYRH